jgi:Acetyltransferase (GNAT) domain
MQKTIQHKLVHSLVSPSRPQPSRNLRGSEVAGRSQTYAVRQIPHEDWDRLLPEFEDTSFEQTAAFASSRWGPDRTVCLAIENAGVIVGGACVVLFRFPVLRRAVAYVKYGPVWRRNGAKIGSKDYRSIVAALVQHLGEEQGHAIVLAPRPSPDYFDQERQDLRALAFEAGRPTNDPNRYFVDLALDEEVQFRNLGQKWRYNLRQSRKNNIQIVWSDDPESIREFNSLYSLMKTRKAFDDCDPADALLSMRRRLPRSLKPQIVLAYHNGNPIAGAAIATCGDTAYYMFGASRDEALPLRAGYAVQWAITQKLREEGVRWYDLGGSVGTEGLRQFKCGLVGKKGTVVDTQGELCYCSGIGARMIFSAVISASKIIQVLRTCRAALGRR